MGEEWEEGRAATACVKCLVANTRSSSNFYCTLSLRAAIASLRVLVGLALIAIPIAIVAVAVAALAFAHSATEGMSNGRSGTVVASLAALAVMAVAFKASMCGLKGKPWKQWLEGELGPRR